jgi:hypothetical protein
LKGYWVAAAALAAATLFDSPSAAAQSSGCDRACLEALLDAYVDAVVAHDAWRSTTASGTPPRAKAAMR